MLTTIKSEAAGNRSGNVNDDSFEEVEEEKEISKKSKSFAKKHQEKVLNCKKKPAGAQISPRSFASTSSTYLSELIAQLNSLSEDERHVRGPLYLDVPKEKFNHWPLRKVDRYFFKPLI